VNKRGRPVGWRKETTERRPMKNMRAWNDEWEIIKRFAKLVKHGDKTACEQALIELETKKEQKGEKFPRAYSCQISHEKPPHG